MLKNRKWWLLIATVMTFLLIMTACAPANTATEAPPAVEEPVEEEPVEEPTVEEEEPTEEPTEEAEEPTEEATEEADEGEAVAGEINCGEAQPGDEITMLYQWSGVEEEMLLSILQPFVDACGVVISPESTRDQGILDTRIQAGTPPDIAFWNVAQLEQYADLIVPLTELGVFEENYPEFWRELGSINGQWLGLPVKADIKTIIWYSPLNFEAFGYEVPTTWAELEELVETIAQDEASPVPWSMGFESEGATGWTGTDFIQDILLVTQGPEFVMGIIDGTIPYNDPAVAEAWEIYGRWARDAAYTVEGAEGTLAIGFNDAILRVFQDPPEAMMVKQSGFAQGTILDQFPDLVYGEDYAFFGVPDAQGLQGGADWMMAFSNKPAVAALIQYLSSEAGAQRWAEVGFDISPNLLATNYENEALADRAELLANASAFVPDIGDSIPGGFGTAEFQGITEYVSGGDLQTILDNLAAIQAEATGGGE
ncbi:MAG TPA: ABC transporter substrate-binding protein [Aggregatilineales bacterium]|jgi:alpha-glucoside transport system substrate-binding protein|nr:carbohydrate ABC transporter substrate-binding protein [Chloroflexota bacterium]HOA25048.1 ABC transporter substrate-binding protein [Aggregatilineales bacterium]HPV07859.1 ABC transporter substrate-binding protein [Aggregatilineales bacterium]HQA67965.1 ABC transporter substrate-binding protein [Aggregatilineales bacterium]HQE18460.1 ABC transporter substrate-binding protein [Aggregatilineales bacterium]